MVQQHHLQRLAQELQQLACCRHRQSPASLQPARSRCRNLVSCRLAMIRSRLLGKSRSHLLGMIQSRLLESEQLEPCRQRQAYHLVQQPAWWKRWCCSLAHHWLPRSRKAR